MKTGGGRQKEIATGMRKKYFSKKMLKCSNQSGDACVLSYREAKRGKFA